MCTKGIHSRVLINTLHQSFDRHLNPYLINILIDTQWTLYWYLINSGSIVGQMSTHLTHMNQSKTCSILDREADGLLIKCQLRCWWSVNRVSIKGPSMNILIHTWSTSRSILNRHSIQTYYNQQSVDSWLSVDRLIWIDRKFVRLSTEMSMKCWSSVNWGVDGVSTEYWSRVSWGYWSVADPDLELRGGPVLFCLPCRLFFLLFFLLLLAKKGGTQVPCTPPLDPPLSIKGIDQQSTTNALSTHDPRSIHHIYKAKSKEGQLSPPYTSI